MAHPRHRPSHRQGWSGGRGGDRRLLANPVRLGDTSFARTSAAGVAGGGLKALVATGGDDLIELSDVPNPTISRADLLVKVEAFSINRCELRRLQITSPGWRPG